MYNYIPPSATARRRNSFSSLREKKRILIAETGDFQIVPAYETNERIAHRDLLLEISSIHLKDGNILKICSETCRASEQDKKMINIIGTLVLVDPIYEGNLFDNVACRMRRWIEGTGCATCGSRSLDDDHICTELMVKTLENNICRGPILLVVADKDDHEIGIELHHLREILDTYYVKKFFPFLRERIGFSSRKDRI